MDLVARILILCITILCGTAEIALENVALRKPTYQVSVDNQNKPFLAVNGNATVNGSCAKTQKTLEPWWLVDLEDVYRLDKIVIFTPISARFFRLQTKAGKRAENGKLATYSVMTPLLCAARCRHDLRCTSFNIGKVGGVCELIRNSFGGEYANVQDADGWTLYSLQYLA